VLTLLSLLACSAAPARPNILLVSIDTLRADRVGRRDAAGRSITPNLDAFAAEAAVFTEAYSQANETLYAHAALFSGRHPSDLGPLDDTRFDLADTPTLASSFRAAGYRTEAVVAGGHLAPEFGLQVGFARYASGRDFGSFQQTVPLALERLDALDDGGAPWLLFVHGYDVHAPYVTWGPLFRQDAPAYDGPLLDASLVPWSFEQILGRARYPGFRPALVDRGEGASVDLTRFDALEAWAAAHPDEAQPLDDADVAFVRALYDGAARYADHHVGILLAELDARGHRDDTVVVVLSDHGEDLLEHGHVNHRLSLHDENLHVPLLVRGSGVQAGVDGALVALVDVLPTLGELAGVAVPAGRGTSLFAPRPDRAVWSEAVRGEVSVRTSDGRLSVPAGASGPWPAQAPPRAFVTGPGGEDRAWEDPLGAALWRRLDEAAP
jgi:arylsulfatase A-like enzyme